MKSSTMIYFFCSLMVIGYTMPMQQQTMLPPSLAQILKKQQVFSFDEAKRSFLADVRNAAPQNKLIPEKEKTVIRIMNFNVRMWTTIYDEPNFDRICALIEQLNPDILILQEVTDWAITYAVMIRQGYNSCPAVCITKDPCFGVAIFSKNCTVINEYHAIYKAQRAAHRQLCFVRLDLNFHNQPISIYGTHLEVDQVATKEPLEAVRLRQVQEIFEDMQQLNHTNIIIAGDFNSVRAKDYGYSLNGSTGWSLLQKLFYEQFNQVLQTNVLDYIALQSFCSSFEILKWQGPYYTNWTGRVLDFIFFSPEWKMPLQGSYAYYTDLSDHLPIIVDIKTK